ncbi:MAG: RagB/SusD family nutrient uptake outer membrane protein [Chitinophagaceae bacterium]
MKHTLYLHIIRLVLLMSFSSQFISCKKYLEEKPDNSLVVPTTIEDFQSLLDDAANMNRTTPSLLESSADDYFLANTEYASRPTREQHVYTWLPNDDYYFANDWSHGYRSVYNANLSIEGLNKINRTDHNALSWNNVMGSALFFRAYHFLNLAWTYAKAYNPATENTDLGIVIRDNADFNTLSVRSSVKATYSRIMEDAKLAASYLPEQPQHVMRPSKSGAFALLARAYLSINQYDSAYRYADLCLSIQNDLLDYNTVSVNSSVPFSPFNKEVIFYTQMNGTVALHAPVRANIDTTLFDSYTDNDLRKKTFFLQNPSGYRRFKGSYAASANNLFSGLATDEVLLIRAECKIRLNDVAGGIDDLNTLLRSRWLTGTFNDIQAGTQEEALNILLIERRKELVMRGIRWSDIKRVNILSASFILKRNINGELFELPPNDKRYALLLPRDVIQNSGIIQN